MTASQDSEGLITLARPVELCSQPQDNNDDLGRGRLDEEGNNSISKRRSLLRKCHVVQRNNSIAQSSGALDADAQLAEKQDGDHLLDDTNEGSVNGGG